MLLTLLDVPDVDSVGGVRFAIGGHYVVRRPHSDVTKIGLDHSAKDVKRSHHKRRSACYYSGMGS